MSLAFPTGRSGRGQVVTAGFPLRPQPRHLCHCGDQRIGDPDDTCERCGRYTPEQVDETWRRRAEHVKASGRRRKATS